MSSPSPLWQIQYQSPYWPHHKWKTWESADDEYTATHKFDRACREFNPGYKIRLVRYDGTVTAVGGR